MKRHGKGKYMSGHSTERLDSSPIFLSGSLIAKLGVQIANGPSSSKKARGNDAPLANAERSVDKLIGPLIDVTPD